MTPTETAKLAMELAEAIAPHGSVPCEAADALRRQCEEKCTPILTAAFADRDEELKRLREAAEKVMAFTGPAKTGCNCNRCKTHLMICAALQPKEPSNES